MPGSGELLIVLIAALLLFKPSELKHIMRKAARLMFEYRRTAKKIEREINDTINIKFKDISDKKDEKSEANGDKPVDEETKKIVEDK